MTTGEGGVVLTNDDGLAERARLFRSHGITRDVSKMDDVDDAGSPWYYEMHQLGYNYRLSDINCALCLNQVLRLAANIQRRQQIAELYMPTYGFRYNAPARNFLQMGQHMHGTCLPRHLILTASENLANRLWPNLLTWCWHTSALHSPVSSTLLPPRFRTGMFHGSETYYKSTLSLPMYSGLTDEDIETISAFVRSVIAG